MDPPKAAQETNKQETITTSNNRKYDKKDENKGEVLGFNPYADIIPMGVDDQAFSN